MDRNIELGKFCQNHSIDNLYAFGSQAAEVYTRLHEPAIGLDASSCNVDVGVKPSRERRLSAHDLVKLAQDLEELFGLSRVKVVSLQDADPFPAANIIRGNRLYVRDEYLVDECDLTPLEHERLALIFGEGS